MFNDKSILVTGATGSFGKAFIKGLLARHRPQRVVVYSRDELKQYDMQQEFTDPAMLPGHGRLHRHKTSYIIHQPSSAAQ